MVTKAIRAPSEAGASVPAEIRRPTSDEFHKVTKGSPDRNNAVTRDLLPKFLPLAAAEMAAVVASPPRWR
jgi:hypothetical protein